MSDTVTLTIDDRQVTVPRGTVILEAAKAAGLDITHFCYHPGLSVAAVCRQCLVEIAGQPKLAPACQVTVAAGMRVSASSPRVVDARRQMLELTLVNHPIDCPICDKAGECLLQRLYFDADARPARTIHAKVKKGKRVDVGPHIVLDQERCILCTRCVRVCDEVAGVHQLEMLERGDHQVLATAPGARLDHPYSLCTVDVCPVGALTSKDFRFAMRVWELEATPLICPGCATGCEIEIHSARGRVHRLIPRLCPEVNRHWMCDEGRLAYRSLREGRVAAARVAGDTVSLERALAAARERLRPLGERLGVVLSARATSEDNLAVLRLAREVLGASRVFVAGPAPVPGRADTVLRDADVAANRAGALALAGDAGGAAELAAAVERGEVTGLLVLGGEDVAAAGLAKLAALVVLATCDSPAVAAASVVLPVAAWAETAGTFVNRGGRVGRLDAAFPPPGAALPALEIAARLGGGGFRDAAAAFAELCTLLPAYAGAAWAAPALPASLRFAGSRG